MGLFRFFVLIVIALTACAPRATQTVAALSQPIAPIKAPRINEVPVSGAEPSTELRPVNPIDHEASSLTDQQATAPLPQAVAAFTATGCAQKMVAGPLTTVMVNGLERQLITRLPADYAPTKRYPLVFAFHGRTNANHQAQGYFGLDEAFPEAIIFYPSGLRRGSGFSWANVGDSADTLRDYALFDELLRLAKSYYCIDETKVFAVGHSLGGYFAASLGCARGKDLRAVALLGGGIQLGQCTARTAALVLHNPNDHLVPVFEGEKARDSFLKINALSSQAVSERAPKLAAFHCQRYPDALAPVLWCPHRFDHRYDGSYYPHTWPSQTAEAIAVFFNSLP